MNYLEDGFNQNLIRDIFKSDVEYDSFNIDALLGTGSLSNAKIRHIIASKLGFIVDGVSVGEIKAMVVSGFGESMVFNAYKWMKLMAVEDIILDTEDQMRLTSADHMIIKTTGAKQIQLLAQDSAGDIVLAAGDDAFVYECDNWEVNFNADNDGSECRWHVSSDIKMRLVNAGNVTCDGAFTGGGADYAELFESMNGKAISSGTPIIFVDGKIREAINTEVPFGVISNNPTIIGNVGGVNADTEWKGKYLKNKDGSFIMEEAEFWSKRKAEKKNEKGRKLERGKNMNGGWSDEIEPLAGAKISMKLRKKLNPEWDMRQKYVSRLDREEWNIVGFLGAVLIKKGSPVASHWKLLGEENDEYNKFFIFPK